MGILSDIIEKELGVRCRSRIDPLLTEVGVNAVRVVPNNPDRLGLIIINLSANVIYMGFDNRVATTRGIYLAPSGGQMVMNYKEDFELVGQEMWGLATGANSGIHVIEVIGVKG